MAFITGQLGTGIQWDQSVPEPLQNCSSIDLTESFGDVGFVGLLSGAPAFLYIHQVSFCRVEGLTVKGRRDQPCDQPYLMGSPSGKLLGH